MVHAETRLKTVLIVEDNDVERECLSAVLRREGFLTQEAATGDQALRSCATHKPDVVLLDMLLPGSRFDGWALLDYLRDRPGWSDLPVIIVTGLDIASLEWCTAHGALDIVKKPVNLAELLGKIARYCA